MKHLPHSFPTVLVSALAALTVAGASPSFAANQGKPARGSSGVRMQGAAGAPAPRSMPATQSGAMYKAPVKFASSQGTGGIGAPHVKTGRGLIAPSPRGLIAPSPRGAGTYGGTKTYGYERHFGPRTLATGYGQGYTQRRTQGYETAGYTNSRVSTRTGYGYNDRPSRYSYGRDIGYGAAGFGLGYGTGGYGSNYGYGSGYGESRYGYGSYGSAGYRYGSGYGGASYNRPTGYDPSTYSPASAYGMDYAAPSDGFHTSPSFPMTYRTHYNCTCSSY